MQTFDAPAPSGIIFAMQRPRSFVLILSLAVLALAGCASTKQAEKAAARKKQAELKLALKHYKQGIDAYTNSRYAEAINHWRITKEKDPDNTMAAEYIQRAENVLKNLGQKVPTAPAKN
jgi:outer membrane protein assembly factor BamD (BamD/ComL family)